MNSYFVEETEKGIMSKILRKFMEAFPENKISFENNYKDDPNKYTIVLEKDMSSREVEIFCNSLQEQMKIKITKIPCESHFSSIQIEKSEKCIGFIFKEFNDKEIALHAKDIVNLFNLKNQLS